MAAKQATSKDLGLTRCRSEEDTSRCRVSQPGSVRKQPKLRNALQFSLDVVTNPGPPLLWPTLSPEDGFAQEQRKAVTYSSAKWEHNATKAECQRVALVTRCKATENPALTDFFIDGAQSKAHGPERVMPVHNLASVGTVSDLQKAFCVDKSILHVAVKRNRNVMLFNLKCMGMTLVEQPKGEDLSAAAVKRIVAMAKARGKKLQKVTLKVSPRGIILNDSGTNELIENISIYRISYCTADKSHDKVFAYIAQSQHSENLECHAFLCPKRKLVSRKEGAGPYGCYQRGVTRLQPTLCSSVLWRADNPCCYPYLITLSKGVQVSWHQSTRKLQAQAVTLTVAQAFKVAFEFWQASKEEKEKREKSLSEGEGASGPNSEDPACLKASVATGNLLDFEDAAKSPLTVSANAPRVDELGPNFSSENNNLVWMLAGMNKEAMYTWIFNLLPQSSCVAIFYVRLNFSITKDTAAEARMKVACITEQVLTLVNKRLGLYRHFDEVVSKYKQSRDISTLNSGKKTLETEPKALTNEVASLQSKLKTEGSDMCVKVSEIQKLGSQVKELVLKSSVEAERLVVGKLKKDTYIENEKLHSNKRQDLVTKIDNILDAL
ncbi:Dolichyl-diphosphooligosaccharide--protein glycosyltransferase subunit 1 [Chelonia mydas]|uniref:Dolichyl-diphosphooligosaccharide--protein glycosyltransferase subunit 1 n=1 Tax=Chelonia mydas TaxID=8469 RepID=M7ART5_CHEMY|nr:Dolichyl-diphosphooligosaccharide--protein glycosyltransferase subunit 1 [Chelonia mydas]